jgi:hypothetical protein
LEVEGQGQGQRSGSLERLSLASRDVEMSSTRPTNAYQAVTFRGGEGAQGPPSACMREPDLLPPKPPIVPGAKCLGKPPLQALGIELQHAQKPCEVGLRHFGVPLLLTVNREHCRKGRVENKMLQITPPPA